MRIARKTIFLACFLTVCLCAPLLARAQAYKCKQPNGSVSFQDQPCEPGATGSALALPSSAGEPPPAADPVKNPARRKTHPALETAGTGQGRNGERQRADAEIQAYNERVKADNKRLRCNQARQQLGVVQESRPVFSRGNDGNRNYVEDKDRAAVLARAEQRVAAECQ